MRNLILSMALILGTTALFSQSNEDTLRLLETMQKSNSSANSNSDTIKISDTNQVYIFIDTISNAQIDKSQIICQDSTTKTVVITISEPDSTKAQKNDITVHMNNLTVSNNSVKYSELDTAILRMGNRRIFFIHDDSKAIIEFPDKVEKHDVSTSNSDINEDANSSHTKKYRVKNRFNVETLAAEFGINGFMDSDNSMSMNGDLALLDLKQARSWNFNFYPCSHGFNIGTPYIGVVTGFGLAFNNYHFSNPVTLKNIKGVTMIDDSTFANVSVIRTKLSTFGIHIPLMLEFHIPTSNYHKLNIAAGVIGEVRVSSKTKVVYDKDGSKQKQRNGNDFNMTTFKYMFTARVGFKDMYIFANYSPVQLFEKNKGPEVYPFSMGFGLSL